jgi:hypothetical protein
MIRPSGDFRDTVPSLLTCLSPNPWFEFKLMETDNGTQREIDELGYDGYAINAV